MKTFIKNLFSIIKFRLKGNRVSMTASVLGQNISMGQNTVIDSHSTLSTLGGGKIVLGKNVKIRSFVQLLTYGGDIIIEDDVVINQFSVLYGHGGLKIGKDTQIATHTVIVPANHKYDDAMRPIKSQGLRTEGIVIGEDVWVGAHALILDGVHLGKGCVVGGGSIVTESVDDFSIVVGNPARVMGHRKGK